MGKNLKEQLKERLGSVEQAYNEVGESRIDFSVFPEHKKEYKEAQYDAEIIIEAARKIEKENGSGEIDWDDYSQYKWLPWFEMSPSRFAFSDSCCGDSGAFAGSGSRLRVLNRETSDHLAETFQEIWKTVQIG